MLIYCITLLIYLEAIVWFLDIFQLILTKVNLSCYTSMKSFVCSQVNFKRKPLATALKCTRKWLFSHMNCLAVIFIVIYFQFDTLHRYGFLHFNLMFVHNMLPQFAFAREANCATVALVFFARWLVFDVLINTIVAQAQAGIFRKGFETNYALCLIVNFVIYSEMVLYLVRGSKTVWT